VEFADWSDITNASLWGRLRDFLIAQFGLDETDKVLPSWQVDSLREEAYRDTGKSEPDFSEHNPNPQQENSTMTEEEIKALQAENTRLKAEATQRAEQEAKTRQDKLHADNVSFAEKLVGDGRLAPKRSRLSWPFLTRSLQVTSRLSLPKAIPAPRWPRRLRRCWTALIRY
jgi:hypothetical protein